MRSIIFSFFVMMSISIPLESAKFIQTQKDLVPYFNRPSTILVASSGRSGSSMLTHALERHSNHSQVLKTHILPPSNSFKGKIIFIYSCPDQSAESALHMTINNPKFGSQHFFHMESSDKEWLKVIKTTTHQTIEHNLLAYDALGLNIQLSEWLFNRTLPCDPSDANILAIKYESLWEQETIDAIRDFTNSPSFQLPPKRARGYSYNQLSKKEKLFRSIYNTGTNENPNYRAYDEARELWEASPAYQYLGNANK